jgi:hypothetical protein
MFAFGVKEVCCGIYHEDLRRYKRWGPSALKRDIRIKVFIRLGTRTVIREQDGENSERLFSGKFGAQRDEKC